MARHDSPRTKKNKKVTRELLDFLVEHDFTTHVRRASTSNSTYIKMDYGANYSIRISDHRGNPKYDFRFNLMLGMTPKEVANFRAQSFPPKYPRFFFAESEIDILKQAILLTMAEQIRKESYTNRYEDCKRLFHSQGKSNAMSFASTAQMYHQRAHMPESLHHLKQTKTEVPSRTLL